MGGDTTLRKGGAVKQKGHYKVLDVSDAPFRLNIYTKQMVGSESQKMFSFFSANPLVTTSTEAHSGQKKSCYAF